MPGEYVLQSRWFHHYGAISLVRPRKYDFPINKNLLVLPVNQVVPPSRGSLQVVLLNPSGAVPMLQFD
jgi:hypothetical protein